MLTSSRLSKDLQLFLSVSGLLTLLGLVFVYSASALYALECFDSAHYFFAQHFISLCTALGGFFCFYFVPLAFWQRYASLFFALSLIGMGSLFALKNHAILIPITALLEHTGYRVQASEFIKFFSCLYLGYFLAKQRVVGWHFGRAYVPLLIIFGFTALLLLRQADISSTVVMLLTLLVMCFVGQCPLRYLLSTLGVVSSVIFLLLWQSPSYAARALSFLNPWTDPTGAGASMIQSLMAIGSGGWWGAQVAYVRDKFFYLPLQHTDFIFSLLAEEVGFAGCLIIIMLYVLFAIYGLRLVVQIQNRFAAYATLGFVVCTMLQVVVNMMVATGMLPTRGLSLPFVSFGGSSLLVLGCMLGFIVNAVVEQGRQSVWS